MAEKLTLQQHMAVHNRGGNILVSAAAGSGKTKVLVDRLLSYLTDPADPANLDEFLIITYTKAAASELRSKIAAKLSERIAQEPGNLHLQRQMQRLYLTKISTVHGFCSDLLREYTYRLDIPVDFRVADESECAELRETVMTELLDNAYAVLGTDRDFKTFLDTQGLGRNDLLVPKIIESVYDSARCHLNPEEWLRNCIRNGTVEGISDVSETVWGRFLMEDLFSYLDSQIHILECGIRQAECCPGFEKPVLNLKATLEQLQSLRSCDSWDKIVSHGAIDYGRLTFPRKNPEPELSERIKAARNACKKGLEKKLSSFSDESAQVLADLEQCAAGARGLMMLVRKFDEAYRLAKKGRRILDFGDLEHKTLDLLLGTSRSGPTAVAGEISRRFREIMVDEYQDSNGVQDAIFRALTRERNNCFLVGDVKQSIYQFRLADPGIFLEKYHAYDDAADALPGQGRKVLLSHNFRSGAEVIEAVNDVFGTCMSENVGGLCYGEGECLREGVPHCAIPYAVELHAIDVQEDTYAEEAAFVAESIHSMLHDGVTVRNGDGFKPVCPEDIVILLRSPGSTAAAFQQALERKGIRCVSGSGMDLLTTEEISTLRSLLQIIVNPRQDIPLISTLASPLFCFSADDLASFRCADRMGTVYDALRKSDMPKAAEFNQVLHALRQMARMGTLTQLLEACYRLTHLDSIYGAMPGGAARRANLQTFYQLAADYENGGLRDLSQFLDHLDSLENRGIAGAGASNSGCVTIMSIHKSKGLEFPVVFLCGLSRAFNKENLRAQILCHKELGIGLSVADTANRVRYPSLAKRAIAMKMAQDGLSEELRVLYVAMTRARDRLIMTYASRNLESDVQDIALRMDFDNGSSVCQEASCPGDWVLLSALHRTEAGQLHNLGARPKETKVSDIPWMIQINQASVSHVSAEMGEESVEGIPADAESMLRSALEFCYPHKSSTLTPSKQTATGRRVGIKAAEAAENTPAERVPQKPLRRPSFAQKQTDAAAYGNAYHAVMQYIPYECGSDVDRIHNEVQRLLEKKLISPEMETMIDCKKIAAFFESEIGKKLSGGVQHLREFKFSILDDANRYGENLSGEQVLLQGVIDCALLEDDGIILVDFKTDRVTEQSLSEVTDRYRQQLHVYSNAISRIYEKPVKAAYLYFFRLNTFVAV